MAESSISVSQDQFNCSICLDLLKDGVTVPCGHSYCLSCISDCWDQEDQKRVYSCPQCRQTFTPRPVLGKNTMLAEVVEKLKKTKLQAARPAQCSSGSGDVECDVCTGDKNKAIMSCLVCLESYCQTHFERHEEFHSGKRHKMTDAIKDLKGMICSQHEKLKEIFCRTDQQCICLLCMVDEHKNHNTVSAAAERTDKQKHLEETQTNFRQRLEERQQELEKLREAVESHKRSAQAAVEDTERIFTELIRSIMRSRSELKQLIRDQEKTAVSQAEGLSERLEQEIEDLRRRDAELEQLSHTDHHIHFLQSFQSLSVPPESTNSPRINISPRLAFDDVAKSLADLKGKMEQFCKEELEKISARVRYMQILLTPEYDSRKEFLQYFQRFTLDPNTAHKRLYLSENNRVFTVMERDMQVPDRPERFDQCLQVLCQQSVCERSYWEVGWTGYDWLLVSVAYTSISRKGYNVASRIGANKNAWGLLCYYDKCLFWHNNVKTDLSGFPWPTRIGVYVDHKAGTLSYYNVSDTMTLIHRVHTTFTEPLYPAFWVDQKLAVRLLDP